MKKKNNNNKKEEVNVCFIDKLNFKDLPNHKKLHFN